MLDVRGQPPWGQPPWGQPPEGAVPKGAVPKGAVPKGAVPCYIVTMPPLTSHMVPLGTACPDFALTDVTSNKVVRRDDFKPAQALLVMFICNHCPFVKHIRTELAKLPRDFASQGLATVGVCSNDPVTHPADGPDAMRTEAIDAGYGFPYLHDAEQTVARAFDAACTPDFFLYDQSRRLVYRGQLDDSRPNSAVPVTGADLRAAITAVLTDRPPVSEQKPAIGCSIKWRAGSAPHG